MGLLDDKKILVTGVTTDDSIAFSVARQAQAHGAEIVLSNAGRALSLTRRVARKLDVEPQVIELDVTDPAHLANVEPTLRAMGWERLDGLLHSIAYAPPTALGHGMFDASWEDVGLAIHISAYSLKALVEATLPMMGRGSSIVGLTFDATVAWPAYDWMGVTKASYESLSRYLARDLGPQGIRCNLVAAGPLRTIAAKSIPGFERFESRWLEQAPLGWDVNDAEPVGQTCVALFSDLLSATTGEVIHADGGFHAIGA